MRKSKTVSASKAVISLQMLPSDANPQGNVHGGTILRLLDVAAAVAAMRHARTNVVSASIDRMDFYHPVFVGNLLVLKASVNYAGRTSMEVGVKIEAEDLKSGKVTHTGSSYVTYVALDDAGRPTNVAEIIPRTAEEKRRWKAAKDRRAQRLRFLDQREKRKRAAEKS
jgi:acyl-CoA hydrolase